MRHSDRLPSDTVRPVRPAPRLPALPPPEPPPARRAADEEVLEEERTLLACATAFPSRLREMRRLQPDNFALPRNGQLFTCLTSLVHRREPIDAVTVCGKPSTRPC
ncbi:DnaB-like helicase N-terminal domain-containing protein [Streptomyces sp. NPDC018045]|uniref:DnaB-like helicase N-terminal domain-containing protein n=1 Tax=Streptomyces sp. NPDC018045 TaxID=3365037 RepID=UPI0037B691B0